MKWIKSRSRFLNEARIGDVILRKQRERIAEEWSEKYLDYEEIEPTDKIKQGKWKLSYDDKIEVLNHFFALSGNPIDMDEIFNIFKNLDKEFSKVLKESIDLELLGEKFKILLEDFNPNEPTIDQISIIYEPIFRKLNVNETKASDFIKKDENGRPIRDEDGNMVRVTKKEGEPIFEKNLVNIKLFVEAYNRCYDNEVDVDIFYGRSISNMISLANENHNSQYGYQFDFKIFDRDVYLSIKHSAQEILNMSISKFFSSCQHLYEGGYRDQLLGNIFDPNSIPAFLVFDTPIYWEDEKISDFLPLSRMMIRSIEKFNEEDSDKILLHRAYPDRMKEVFDKMVEKYSGNKKNIEVDSLKKYVFTPDIDPEDKLKSPYMDDNLSLERHPYIGTNAKSLYLNKNYDWSKIKISPKAKLKEIVIETNDVPENLFQINLNPDWIKFKFIKINDLSNFNLVKTDSIAFDKCSFSPGVLNNWPNSDGIKKLQIISCEIDGGLDISNFKNLEELHLIYTLDEYSDITDIIGELESLKKIVISGDLMSGEGKKYFNELKSRGIKIETVGPVI